MASNYEKEPIFVLERTWDDQDKLPEKHKFQGNSSLKAKVNIDSGTYGMEFFLEKTLPQFNQAGSKLDWSWPQMFLEFENVLGDSYRTTWLEVLIEHFPEPVGKETNISCNEKEDFDHAISFFICKILHNKKPHDLQYIYMAPGGNCRLTKDLLTLPRLHTQRVNKRCFALPSSSWPATSPSQAIRSHLSGIICRTTRATTRSSFSVAKR
jgi:hypothetical protein